MTASNHRNRKIYMVTLSRSCSEKVAYLKERAALVFQAHYTIHSCGALCTYSLYDKQVNGAVRGTERFIKPFRPQPLNRKRGTLQIGALRDLTVIALSIPYWSFRTSGQFPAARAVFPVHGAPTRKAALSRLDVGPAYYEDPVIPHIAFLPPGSRGSYAAAFPVLFFSASTGL
ncbi:hypothetical protein IFM89_039178 [Coptis chinensis]|uniref:Uncharacterized protein n=1 Tax=Coptis chinensis TaxID=261450 RepID=A0A835H234_9MAGN|nr:hypothetical protein IFM89_039178 [Coptis chinensis]